jgi:hypothetical protein
MELIEALRIVYDLAEGNQLDEGEADTSELQEQRREQESALEMVHQLLRDGMPPVRVIVDISGGTFNGVLATVPCEVLAIDQDDENNNATVPGYTGEIWAGKETAQVAPAAVNMSFDGIEWLPDEE